MFNIMRPVRALKRGYEHGRTVADKMDTRDRRDYPRGRDARNDQSLCGEDIGHLGYIRCQSSQGAPPNLA